MGYRYPNLLSGTDKWTSWWTPEVGKDNSCIGYTDIVLPRPLAQDDVVSVSVDLEFDRLDMTADRAVMAPQGDVDGSWHYYNPFADAVFTARRDLFFGSGVLDGEIEVAGTIRVDGFSYNTEAGSYNQSPAGHRKFAFGFRANYCGGAPQSAPSHGRARRGGRTARMGTVSRGGVAVDE